MVSLTKKEGGIIKFRGSIWAPGRSLKDGKRKRTEKRENEFSAGRGAIAERNQKGLEFPFMGLLLSLLIL